MVDPFFVRLDWGVNVVIGEVEEERLRWVALFEELDRLFGEALGEVFTFALGLECGICPRRVVATGRRAAMVAADVDVEALIRWPCLLYTSDAADE